VKVLIDIVHPADVLFFLNPIKELRQNGHDVKIVSRIKDVTCELLDLYGLAHKPISKVKKGVIGLGLELIKRDISLFKEVRDFRPDVMAGFGGVSISHVGKLLGVPSLSFYDTEKANLQLRLTTPFITHMYVPDSYQGDIPAGKSSIFPGTKDFSYFHKDNFKPDIDSAVKAGLVPKKKNYFIRLVAWNANHDFGVNGWNVQVLAGVIDYLTNELGGVVHLSSEDELPENFSNYLYKGDKHLIHHLLSHCELYIGESATMAGEAVMLGVPAIYAANDQRGYTDELENQGLLWTLLDIQTHAICNLIKSVQEVIGPQWDERLDGFYEGKINLSHYIRDEIVKHGSKV
jgi:predicted glycosyltransferase